MRKVTDLMIAFVWDFQDRQMHRKVKVDCGHWELKEMEVQK